MNLCRSRGIIVPMLALHMALTPECFGQRKAYVPSFTPPTQNYAVIDISGSVQGSNNVRAIALDDTNKAAFAFSTATAPLPGNLAAYFGTPDANAEAYTWQNGNLGPDVHTDLTASVPIEPGYNYNFFFAHLGGVDTSGAVYGSMFNMFASQDESYPIGQISCMFRSNGACSPITPPYPFTSADESGSPDGPVDVSPLGVVIGWQNAYEYSWTLVDNTLTFTCNQGNYTAFVGDSDFSGITPDPHLSLQPYLFFPSIVNNQGAALGDDFDSGVGSADLWTGQSLIPISLGSDEPCCLNDQNQAGLVTNVFGSTGEGYLWENNITTKLRDTLPFWFQWQYSFVWPDSISNQIKPAPAPPLLPNSTTDVTIHLLADVYDSVVGASSKALLSRDNNSNWNFSSIALPTGTTISQWTSINSSGVIAAIGTTSSDPAHQHALLLVPIQVMVACSNGKMTWQDGVQAGSQTQYSYLNSPKFTITAAINQMPNLSVTLGIVQDFEGSLQVGYMDGSYQYAQTSPTPGTYGYLADDLPPPPPQPNYNTATDPQGNTTCTKEDAPYLTIGPRPRSHLSYALYQGKVRDFITAQTYGSSPQIVTELCWSYSLSATFDADAGSPNPYSPTVLDSVAAPSTKPTVGGVSYGQVPSATPVPRPPNQTANSYWLQPNNYFKSGSAQDMANTYPAPSAR